MRYYIPLVYFSDPTNYDGAQQITVAAILVYSVASLFNQPPELYWDPFDPKQIENRTMSEETRAMLESRIRDIHHLLEKAGLDKIAKQYVSGQAKVMQSACASNLMLVGSLFRGEKRVIYGAWAAAQALAVFRDSGNADPDAALRALAEFGERLTTAFNHDMNSVYSRNTLRPVGPLVLMEAARAFDDTLGASTPVASLRVAVVKDGAPFPAKDKDLELASYDPAPETLLATDRLTSLT